MLLATQLLIGLAMVPRAPPSGGGHATAASAAVDTRPLTVCTTASSLEGVAFCKHALEGGNFRVRALCRNPDSYRARELASMGAEVVVADNNDLHSLVQAFEGAHSVYAITTWSGSSFTSDGTVVRSENLDSRHLEESEVSQGANILRAAERTPTLRHFLLQSMHRGGRSEPPDPSTPAPLHHRAKWRRASSPPPSSRAWSVLRQPTYMENFANETAAQGTQLRLLRPGVVSGLRRRTSSRSSPSTSARWRRSFEWGRSGTAAAGSRRARSGSADALAAAAERAHGAAAFQHRQVPWFVLEYFIPVEHPRQLKRWLTRGGNDQGASKRGRGHVRREPPPTWPDEHGGLPRRKGHLQRPVSRSAPDERRRRSAAAGGARLRVGLCRRRWRRAPTASRRHCGPPCRWRRSSHLGKSREPPWPPGTQRPHSRTGFLRSPSFSRQEAFTAKLANRGEACSDVVARLFF